MSLTLIRLPEYYCTRIRRFRRRLLFARILGSLGSGMPTSVAKLQTWNDDDEVSDPPWRIFNRISRRRFGICSDHMLTTTRVVNRVSPISLGMVALPKPPQKTPGLYHVTLYNLLFRFTSEALFLSQVPRQVMGLTSYEFLSYCRPVFWALLSPIATLSASWLNLNVFIFSSFQPRCKSRHRSQDL